MNCTIPGDKSEYLILDYFDFHDSYVNDTVSIDNGRFTVKGTLNNRQLVSITSNLSSRNMDKPNLLSFFIEPITIEIDLVENKFKEDKISCSNAQEEYEFLSSITKPLIEDIEALGFKLHEIFEKRKTTKDNIAIDNEADKISKDFENKILDIREDE